MQNISQTGELRGTWTFWGNFCWTRINFVVIGRSLVLHCLFIDRILQQVFDDDIKKVFPDISVGKKPQTNKKTWKKDRITSHCIVLSGGGQDRSRLECNATPCTGLHSPGQSLSIVS